MDVLMVWVMWGVEMRQIRQAGKENRFDRSR
jgi:hypothetical protein